MDRQLKPRRLIILSLIAVLISIFPFTSLPTPTRAANVKGAALIARAQYDSYGSRVSDYTLLAMDRWGNSTTLATPPTLSKGGV